MTAKDRLNLALLWVLWAGCSWANELPQPSTERPGHQLEVRDACIRLPLPGQTTAVVYMTVLNSSQQPVAIQAVEVSGASRSELHQHLHQDGMMRMRKVERVEVPAAKSVAFRPGGYHIMAFHLQPESAADGHRVTLTLTDGASVSVLVRSECDSLSKK